jgi:hypothetical protein
LTPKNPIDDTACENRNEPSVVFQYGGGAASVFGVADRVRTTLVNVRQRD